MLVHLSFLSILIIPTCVYAQEESNESNNPSSDELLEINRSLIQISERLNNIQDKQNQIIPLKKDQIIPIEIKNTDSKFYENPVLLAFISSALGAGFGFLTSLKMNQIQKAQATQAAQAQAAQAAQFQQAQENNERVLYTTELWKYWDSSDMRLCRTMAWRIFYLPYKYKHENLGALLLSYYMNGIENPKDIIFVLRISDFFDRLNSLKENNLVNPERAKEFFANDYKNWHDEFFTDDLKKSLRGSELDGIVEKVDKCSWLTQ